MRQIAPQSGTLPNAVGQDVYKRQAVLCLMLLSSLNALVINSLPIYGGDTDTTYQVISTYTTGFFYLLAIFLPPLIYLKIRGLAVADFIPTQRVSAGLAILMVGLGVGVSLLSNQASSWVSTQMCIRDRCYCPALLSILKTGFDAAGIRQNFYMILRYAEC